MVTTLKALRDNLDHNYTKRSEEYIKLSNDPGANPKWMQRCHEEMGALLEAVGVMNQTIDKWQGQRIYKKQTYRIETWFEGTPNEMDVAIIGKNIHRETFVEPKPVRIPYK